MLQHIRTQLARWVPALSETSAEYSALSLLFAVRWALAGDPAPPTARQLVDYADRLLAWDNETQLTTVLDVRAGALWPVLGLRQDGDSIIAACTGWLLAAQATHQPFAELWRAPLARLRLLAKQEAVQPWHRLFDPSSVSAVIASEGMSDVAIRGLKAGGGPGNDGFRPLHLSPGRDAGAPLRPRFPQFGQVLDFVEQHLALAECGTDVPVLHLPPFLLRGAPGVGKSYFAQELAAALRATYFERDLSVTTEAFVLTGSSSVWQGGKPGLVFDALVHGEAANPVICLNEVDKCTGVGASHNSPISALFALLEPATSRTYQDEYAPVKLDASRISWVLTANDGHIPEPILSRVQVFEIEPPTEAQWAGLAQSVWGSVLKSFPAGHPFPLELPADLVAATYGVSPREFRNRLLRMAGIAALANRSSLALADWEQLQSQSKRKPRMGFMS